MRQFRKSSSQILLISSFVLVLLFSELLSSSADIWFQNFADLELKMSRLTECDTTEWKALVKPFISSNIYKSIFCACERLDTSDQLIFSYFLIFIHNSNGYKEGLGSVGFQYTKSRRFTKVELCLNKQKQPLEVLYKKTVFKNLAIFTGKGLCCSLF